jgi:hypothetical protein
MFQIPVHPGKYSSDFMTRRDKGFRSKTGGQIAAIDSIHRLACAYRSISVWLCGLESCPVSQIP